MNVWMMLKVMLLGLGTVFVVLVLLIGMIWLINQLLNRDKKQKAVPQETGAEAAVETAETAETVEEDDTLVAVITAAVCACLNTSTHNFRVRSIRERKSRWGRW